MKNYSELLRDPRWQKKRLEVLQRDSFCCQSCGAKEKPLHVHHCFYKNEKMPWDYPAESLVTLCEDCHTYESDLGFGGINSLAKQLSCFGFMQSDFEYLSICLFKELENKKIRFSRKDLMRFFVDCICVFSRLSESAGRKTDSAETVDNIPTGEGSSAREKVERKSDAIA